MGSRLRKSPSQLYDVFVEISSKKGEEEPFIHHKFPESFAEEDLLKQLPLFAFPCEPESRAVEHFTFTLTDIEGKLRFGFCRLSGGGTSCLCIISWLPWYDVFYKILNKLSDILKHPSDEKDLTPLLTALLHQPIPSEGETRIVVTGDGKHELQLVAPSADKLPSLITDRNLAEYCNVLDYRNRIAIFASLLHERRILFTSLKISRLSACVHACAALIYPMHWQHIYLPVLPSHLLEYCCAPMPYLIGVHSYLMDRVRKMDIGDAIIVDADHNEMISPHEDVQNIPNEVLSSLRKHLKVESAGDNVARCFLKALVMLIGGYREGAKLNGATLMFNPQTFLLSRPPSMKHFLEKILDLQIFRQFIDERLDQLNQKQGFNDEFEREAVLWADKYSLSNSKYKDLMANAKKLQKEGKDQLTGLANKMKSKSKLAVKGLKHRLHEIAKEDEALAQRSTHVKRANSYKQSMLDSNDSSTGHSEPRPLMGRPLRPPLPSLPEKLNKLNVGLAELTSPNRRESYTKARHYSPVCFDDDDITESRVSMNLMEDPDIQSVVKKSFSLDDITAEDSSEDSDTSSATSVTNGFLFGNGINEVAPVPPPRRKGRSHDRADFASAYADGSSISDDSTGLAAPWQSPSNPESDRKELMAGDIVDVMTVLLVDRDIATLGNSIPVKGGHDSSEVIRASQSNVVLLEGESTAEAKSEVYKYVSGADGKNIVKGAASMGCTALCVPVGAAAAAADHHHCVGAAAAADHHYSELVSLDTGKNTVPRRATPRIEQLQKELIGKVQQTVVKNKQMATMQVKAEPDRVLSTNQPVGNSQGASQQSPVTSKIYLTSSSHEGDDSLKGAIFQDLGQSAYLSKQSPVASSQLAPNGKIHLHQDLVGLQLDIDASIASSSTTIDVGHAQSMPASIKQQAVKPNYYVCVPSQLGVAAPAIPAFTTTSVKSSQPRGHLHPWTLASGMAMSVGGAVSAECTSWTHGAHSTLSLQRRTTGIQEVGKSRQEQSSALHNLRVSVKPVAECVSVGSAVMADPFGMITTSLGSPGLLKPQQLSVVSNNPALVDPFADLVNLKNHL